MTAMTVKLTNEQMEQIADYIAEKYPALKQKSVPRAASRDIEIEIRERIVRVEEELKNQREILKDLLHSVDKRFEQVDKRFEQVDKRFEELRTDMNRRFTMMMWFTGTGFALVTGFISWIVTHA